MGSCAAPSAKGDDKFITTDYLQQCRLFTSDFAQKKAIHSDRMMGKRTKKIMPGNASNWCRAR
ncbi:hypothetical protein DL718_22370 [Escherichia coli]|nr:hypothetical protein DL718_22370 [Escherichia coli]